MGLHEVRAAAEALRRAMDNRASAMAGALAEGLSVTDVAEAAGVTRQTVYRLTRVTMPGRSDREVLDAGLGAILEAGEDYGPATRAEVMKALSHHDLMVKARRVRLAAQNAPAGMTVGRATEELQDAMLVAGRLLDSPGQPT